MLDEIAIFKNGLSQGKEQVMIVKGSIMIDSLIEDGGSKHIWKIN